jgi:hypothetical protein
LPGRCPGEQEGRRPYDAASVAVAPGTTRRAEDD